jgi:hypothetical protein
MSEASAAEVPPQPAGLALGVIDAMGMGWRLLMSDFWMLWLLSLVLFAVLMGVGLVSCCLLCLAPLVAFFVQPPLEAGLFKALKGRIDGAAVNFNDLFAAFPECYWQAVLAGLPVILIEGTMQLVELPVRIVGQLAGPLSQELQWPAEVLIPVVIGGAGVVLLFIVALLILRMFFAFTLLAVWDHKESGVEAIKVSMRLVKSHFWSIIGLNLLFAMIGIAALIVGLLACLVGMAITIPAVHMWHQTTLVYLYRSWTGQPLVQPLPGAAMPDAPALPEGALPA